MKPRLRAEFLNRFERLARGLLLVLECWRPPDPSPQTAGVGEHQGERQKVGGRAAESPPKHPGPVFKIVADSRRA